MEAPVPPGGTHLQRRYVQVVALWRDKKQSIQVMPRRLVHARIMLYRMQSTYHFANSKTLPKLALVSIAALKHAKAWKWMRFTFSPFTNTKLGKYDVQTRPFTIVEDAGFYFLLAVTLLAKLMPKLRTTTSCLESRWRWRWKLCLQYYCPGTIRNLISYSTYLLRKSDQKVRK